MSKNPYPTQPGFGLRVANAKRVLKRKTVETLAATVSCLHEHQMASEIFVYIDGKFFDRISIGGGVPHVIAMHSGHLALLQRADAFTDPVCGASISAYYERI